MAKHRQRGRPTWTADLATMIAEDVIVSALCDTCRVWKSDIDLAALAAIKGGDYCLWNRRTRCRMTPGCKGWVSFQYVNRGGIWTRPMRD